MTDLAILARCQLITYCPICESGEATRKHDCCNPPDSETYMSFQQTEKLVAENELPIKVTLSHYPDSMVEIGSVITWTNDEKALTAQILLDDISFIEAIVRVSSLYFRQLNLFYKPLLFLRKIFPGFSLCHDRNTLIVDHVAIVCVPKRYGSIAEYEWTSTFPTTRQSYAEGDEIIAYITAVTSEGLTIDNRTDLLRKNLKYCRNPDDCDFIYAGVMKNDNKKLFENEQEKTSYSNVRKKIMEQAKNTLFAGLLNKLNFNELQEEENNNNTTKRKRKSSNNKRDGVEEKEGGEEDPALKKVRNDISKLQETIGEVVNVLKQQQQQQRPSTISEQTSKEEEEQQQKQQQQKQTPATQSDQRQQQQLVKAGMSKSNSTTSSKQQQQEDKEEEESISRVDLLTLLALQELINKGAV